ncbi:MAG: hypothetical protein GX221_11690 [Candidatus Riflebacteria bacterium]|nr:hypothetical protein [Candidatus Riflebacteria bacterium]
MNNKNKFGFLEVIESLLLNNKRHISARDYIELESGIHASIRKIIKRHELQNVIQEEQITETAGNFMLELLAPSETSFIMKLKAAAINGSLQEEYGYILARLFTLLKENAPQNVQEYFLFSDAVKKTLKKLAKSDKISQIKLGCYAISATSELAQGSTISFPQEIVAKIPLKRQLVNTNVKNMYLEESIIQLLTACPAMYFRANVIASALYKYVEQPSAISIEEIMPVNSDNTTAKNIEIPDMSGNPDSQMSSTALDEAVSDIFALFDLQNEDKKDTVLLCGLGYFAKLCPDFFTPEDLGQDNYELLCASALGETDTIQIFLDKIAKSHLLKVKTGRTTTSNMTNFFKNSLSPLLQDYTIEEQRQIIRALVHRLLEEYAPLLKSR